MLSVAFVGTWHVHTDDYARQIRQSGKARIAAVWDDDAARGQALAQANGVPFVGEYDDLLARPDVQAVVCNAPTTMHPELLAAAARAGKHVFTEKLLATSTAECEQLCAGIREVGVTFTISLPLRCEPAMLYAKQLVDTGALGRISGARMRRSHSGVSDNWLPERWFDTTKSGGGAMMDLGAHPAYMLSFLFGAPKRVSGMTTNLYGTSSDENAIALAEFPGGVLATAETAFVTHGVPDRLEIYGTEGSLFIRGNEVRLATKALQALGISAASPDQLPPARPAPLQQFIDACLAGTGTPEHLGLEDALIMTRLIEATYRSDGHGQITLR